MAYVLGYFAADGSMLKNNRGACFIEFKSIDKNLVEKVKVLLNSNHRISARNWPEKWSTIYRLQIGSKDIYADLLTLGFTQTKSCTMVFPQIPIQFISHFVRGYFDGDGHVSISEYNRSGRKKKSKTIISGFTSGSKDFLKNLHKILKRYANILGGSLYYKEAYRLSFSVQDSKRLQTFLYKNAYNLCLSRKRKVFEKYFK